MGVKIPPHITGLKAIHLNSHNENETRRIFYDVLRTCKFKIVEWIQPHYPKNFFEVIVIIDDKEFVILLHEFYPFLAFADKNVEGKLIFSFIDMPILESEFEAYYQVLSKAYLEKPFIPREHNLTEEELKDAKYWRPENIGEVIFNVWD